MTFIKRSVKNFLNLFIRYGVGGYEDFTYWMCRTYFVKFRIRVEDKFRWLSYPFWKKLYSSPPSGFVKSINPSPLFATFLILMKDTSPGQIQKLEMTLGSLKDQIIPKWECFGIFSSEIQVTDQKRFNNSIADSKVTLCFRNGITSKDSEIQAVRPLVKWQWLIWTRGGDSHHTELLNRILGLAHSDFTLSVGSISFRTFAEDCPIFIITDQAGCSALY
jgi:hypothetical protein